MDASGRPAAVVEYVSAVGLRNDDDDEFLGATTTRRRRTAAAVCSWLFSSLFCLFYSSSFRYERHVHVLSEKANKNDKRLLWSRRSLVFSNLFSSRDDMQRRAVLTTTTTTNGGTKGLLSGSLQFDG